jgi:hypothetical protein
MANQKISNLTALTGVDPAADLLVIVDSSVGETKKVTTAELVRAAGLVPYADSLVMGKAYDKGIKVDTAAPTYPWADLLGEITVRGTGANDPSFDVYRGSIRQYSFGTSGMKECFNNFHIPHDYVLNSSLYIHAHWSCIAAHTGNIRWYFDITYAKGHNQAAFPAPVTANIVQASSEGAYQHMIAEVQISAETPAGSQIDSNNIEPDGLLLLRTYRDPSDLSDTLTQAPFLHYVDIHYQSTGIGTKQKSPPFWT